MRSLRTALVVAAIAWPVFLGSVVWARANGARPAWTTVAYAIGSRICHQRPERSFRTAGVQWPVCARCSGLYLAAPLGAVLALVVGFRRPSEVTFDRWLFAVAAVPTVLTLAIEWSGLSPLSNAIRAASALPLGVAIAFLIVRTTGPDRSIG